MARNSDTHFSGWLYKIGATILFFLALVAMFAFIKALCVTGNNDQRNTVTPADSIQIEALKKEMQYLNNKVDTLIILMQKEPHKVYRYIKPKIDSCTIEVNIHNK